MLIYKSKAKAKVITLKQKEVFIMVTKAQEKTMNLLRFQQYMNTLGYVNFITRPFALHPSSIEIMFVPLNNTLSNLAELIKDKDSAEIVKLLNHILKDYQLNNFKCYGRKDALWVQEF